MFKKALCETKKIYFMLIFLIIITPLSIYANEADQTQKDAYLDNDSIIDKSEDIKQITLDNLKQVDATEEGTILVFSPKKDGLYLFELAFEEKSLNRNIVLELLDKDNVLLNTNKGSKYDVYDNTYDSGRTVAIAQGGETDDSLWYYNSIKQNLYANNKYYIRLSIPSNELQAKENMQELIDDGASVVEIGENGEVVEKDDYNLEVNRTANLLVSYEGEIDASKEDNESSLLARLILVILIILIFIIIFKKLKRKENNKVDDKTNIYINTENKNDASKYCANCGNKLESDDQFCGKCGNKVE